MSKLIKIAMILGLTTASAPSNAQESKSRWIESWGTAQQLGPAVRLKLPPRPTAPTPAPLPTSPSPMVPYPETLGDQTVRMVVRMSVGGPQFRLEFGNAQGDAVIRFGAVRVALAAKDSAIVAASDRAVTFGGKAELTLFPGAKAVSDPIDLPVKPLIELAVSVHLPDPTPTNTVHVLGLAPVYIASGNVVSATRFDQPVLARSYFWLTALSVPARTPGAGTIVAFGDSITDGYATSAGMHRAWPDLLAERLQSSPETADWGVVNAGISGNRVLKAGAGDSALARFDEDVLSRPGVKWVLLLEGINDINMTIMPVMPESENVTAEQIIAGYVHLIDRAHHRGIKIAGGTLLPTMGLPFYSEQGEAMRETVNNWIRTSGRFDAVIDFDAVVRDPANRHRLRPNFDPGDHVHPNDAGNRAMAEAIDLTIFE